MAGGIRQLRPPTTEERLDAECKKVAAITKDLNELARSFQLLTTTVAAILAIDHHSLRVNQALIEEFRSLQGD